MKLRLLALLMPAIIAGACSSVDCPVQNTVSTKYHFYTSDGERGTLRDTLTVSTTRRDGRDSILLNRSVNTSEFTLPISYDSPEDTLVFRIHSGIEGAPVFFDTVYVAKTNLPQFESAECHIAFFHEITEVRHTNHLIDSIAVNKRTVNYDSSTEHFHIYLKTGN